MAMYVLQIQLTVPYDDPQLARRKIAKRARLQNVHRRSPTSRQQQCEGTVCGAQPQGWPIWCAPDALRPDAGLRHPGSPMEGVRDYTELARETGVGRCSDEDASPG
jgi:hypothetical protein